MVAVGAGKMSDEGGPTDACESGRHGALHQVRPDEVKLDGEDYFILGV